MELSPPAKRQRRQCHWLLFPLIGPAGRRPAAAARLQRGAHFRVSGVTAGEELQRAAEQVAGF